MSIVEEKNCSRAGDKHQAGSGEPPVRAQEQHREQERDYQVRGCIFLYHGTYIDSSE